MKANDVTRYEDRIARVCAYIEHNLDDDLSLDVLSNVAAFSKYHFPVWGTSPSFQAGRGHICHCGEEGR